MIDYRACPKCRGDMHTRQDTFGAFKECIQCGMMQDLELEKNSKTLAGTDTTESKKGEAA
jgi:DNA-directed RNA polymerase subunit M/transcription elongation factor TFIIS